MAGCSHRAIARARRVLDEERLSSAEQVAALSAEDLDRLFADGRKNVAGVRGGGYRQGRHGTTGS